MTIKNPHGLQDEDKRLKTGTLVDVYWSRAGFSYQGRGRIVKLRHSTVTVSLSEDVTRGEGADAGTLVTVPRIIDTANWSSHNCVRLTTKAKKPAQFRLAG